MAPEKRIARRFRHEAALFAEGRRMIAGVDEAGRGPLAGPVVAAAVILPAEWIENGLPRRLRGMNDSKQLTPEERDYFYSELVQHPEIRFGVSQVDVEMIDLINILQATHRAMNDALAALTPTPEHVLVDGLPVKTLRWTQTAIVDGDCLSYSIAAASIIAKVTRDRQMVAYHEKFPEYGFHNHKGYGTPEHVEAIRKFGLCPIHRQTFSPCRMVQPDMFD